MQRYYLHLKFLTQMVVDPDGSEHPNVDDAIQEAKAAIRDIAAQSIRIRNPLALSSIRICDANGNQLSEVFASETLSELLLPAFLDLAASARRS
jgi:hypothetical protein